MKVNQLKAGVILTYMTTFLSMVISFAYTPIMINILGQGEYGLYTLVNSVVANLAILSFGFGSAYIRFYSRYKAKNDKEGIAKLNGMFMSVFTVIAIITLTVGAFLVANVENIFKEFHMAECLKEMINKNNVSECHIDDIIDDSLV